jgi:hypothetical protein
MRCGDGSHAHLAATLGAIQAGHAGFVEQFAPRAVGQNHHFGDQLVHR